MRERESGRARKIERGDTKSLNGLIIEKSNLTSREKPTWKKSKPKNYFKKFGVTFFDYPLAVQAWEIRCLVGL